MLRKHLVVALAALAGSAAAQAQVGVTADLGTTGAGFHLVVPMEKTLNGRFGVNYYKHDFDRRSGGVNYDADARLQTYDVLFDWYAFDGSPFRLTGGVLYNASSASANARPDADGNYRINGRGYRAADVGALEARVDFQKAAPYFGIGWGNALSQNKRWSFSGDLGAFYHGKAHVSLRETCSGGAITCIVLRSDVQAEAARLREQLSDHKFFPVLRASVSYRF